VADGHRFDVGPSIILLPDAFEETYCALGEDMRVRVALPFLRPATCPVLRSVPSSGHAKQSKAQTAPLSGRSAIQDHLDLVRIDPTYRIHFPDGSNVHPRACLPFPPTQTAACIKHAPLPPFYKQKPGLQ
jgi:hypothetical protein